MQRLNSQINPEHPTKPMTRATTPQDPLAPLPTLEEGNSIPASNRPWLSVGQIVQGVTLKESRYYARQLVKKKGKRFAKEILNLLANAEQLEYSIAGVEAYYALPTIMICNQCYVENGQSNSGLTWHYKVLIKGVLEDNHICVIPDVWIGEQNFVPLTEQEFQPKAFYRDNRGCVYKCVFKSGEPEFVYVGHIRADGRLGWDNHITPRRLSPWQRRHFQPYTLPEKIVY